jgi:hypothetical protein
LACGPGAAARRISRAVVARPVMRGKKKGKEKGGADRWGRAIREREKRGAAEEGRGQLGYASWADRGVEGRTGRLAGLKGKEKSRPGWPRS